MKKPDEKVQTAFRALKGNPHWDIISEYFNQCFYDAVLRLSKPVPEDYQVRFFSGELSVLVEIQALKK